MSVGDDGIYRQWRGVGTTGGPLLLCDRDGTLIEYKPYLHRPVEVRLLPGVRALFEACLEAGIGIAIVTNQAGIGRGYYGWSEFVSVQQELDRQLGAAAAAISCVIACPFHPEATLAEFRRESNWRKPNPGMLVEALEHLHADRCASAVVGDRSLDIRSGREAGVGCGFLVATGLGLEADERAASLEMGSESFTVTCIDGLTALIACWRPIRRTGVP